MSRRRPRAHSVHCMLFWPTRANIDSFRADVSGDAFGPEGACVQVSYISVIHIAEVPFSADSWTQVDLNFHQNFQGGSEEFCNWMRTANGRKRMLDEVLRLQNFAIDHIKAENPFNENVRNLRHFGPAEWPYLMLSSDGIRCFERANSALRFDVSTQKMVFLGLGMQSGFELPPTIRNLLRACDLAECGYPTEAVLLCAGLLDATVQRLLIEGMGGIGLRRESADELLRNTTQRRLSTYLDSVLKLICGQSLREDDESLFQRVIDMNRQRNEAIHNGREMQRSDAQAACLTTYDALDYLRVVIAPSLALSSRPVFAPD